MTDLLCAGGVTEEELLRCAASIEKPSEHPLAEAILTAAEEGDSLWSKQKTSPPCRAKGLNACWRENGIIAGNRKRMERAGLGLSAFLSAEQAFADDGKTPLYFADEDRVLGLIAVADVIKETSAEAIRALEGWASRWSCSRATTAAPPRRSSAGWGSAG